MLYPAIENIQRLLDQGITPTVAIGNVVEIANGNDEQNDADIIVSLVNIEEVRIARDQRYVVKVDGLLLPKNAPVHFDLSLLFTAFGGGYENSIRNLQEVIAFFQKHSVFSSVEFAGLAADGIERLTMEMVTLGLEQLQQMWSMLGGRYQPSVLYKMRMLTIDSIQENPVLPITQIRADFKRKN